MPKIEFLHHPINTANMSTKTHTLEIHPHARGLIFDLDGTLADTMPAHFMAWQQIACEEGFEFPESRFYELAGVPTFTILEQMNQLYNLSMDTQAVTIRKEEAFLSFADQVFPIEPVIEIVYRYHQRLPLACGTGGIRKVAHYLLEKLDITQYFEAVITADDVDAHKPDPDTFLKCAEEIKISPEFCQVFEDGEPGIIAAQRAGMIVTDVRPHLKQ